MNYVSKYCIGDVLLIGDYSYKAVTGIVKSVIFNEDDNGEIYVVYKCYIGLGNKNTIIGVSEISDDNCANYIIKKVGNVNLSFEEDNDKDTNDDNE